MTLRNQNSLLRLPCNFLQCTLPSNMNFFISSNSNGYQNTGSIQNSITTNTSSANKKLKKKILQNKSQNILWDDTTD